MSYAALETSTQDGAPVELYTFAQGTQFWRFTTAPDPVTYAAVEYTPSSVSRDRIKQTSDVLKDSLKLEFPRGDAFASQFLGFAPDTVTTVTIMRGHVGDNEFIPYWKGRVIAAVASGNKIELACESVFSSIRRPGLRARYELACRHALYSARCGVNLEASQDTGVTSVVSGVTISVPAAAGFADGYFTGGMIKAPDESTRFIVAHTGAVLTVQRPIAGLAVGATVRLYPGCDHLQSTCAGKFNNLDNFGGFPWIPIRNPYDGRSIV